MNAAAQLNCLAGRSLVTGGAGFIGGHLTEALAAAGASPAVFDLVRPTWSADVPSFDGDIRDPAALRAAMTGVETVFHLASVVGVRRYLASPIEVIDVAVLGTKNVLAEAARVGARVVMVSTSEVFGRNPQPPWAEDADRVLGSTALTRWSYGSAKGTAEHLALGWHSERGLPVTVVRPFNVYGPRQRTDFLLPAAVHAALNGRTFPVHDGGGQTRSFTQVGDVVSGIVAAATSPLATGEVFNLGATDEISVLEAVTAAYRVAGVPLDVVDVSTRSEMGSGFEDIGRRSPDGSKAERLLGWKAKVSLEPGLAGLVAWARENQQWLNERPPEEQPASAGCRRAPSPDG